MRITQLECVTTFSTSKLKGLQTATNILEKLIQGLSSKADINVRSFMLVHLILTATAAIVVDKVTKTSKVRERDKSLNSSI